VLKILFSPKAGTRPAICTTRQRLAAVLSRYGVFLANYFSGHHLSAGVGWYLNAIVVAEAVLFACAGTGLAGVRRAAAWVGATALLALVLDLYTVHFLLAPYYAGLTRHRPSGALEAFHIAYLSRIGIQEYFHRLTPVGLWASCSTIPEPTPPP
jgi:hypothetical protein